ncbi:MAG TPA: aldehyde ferredoxin oxidoreductase family protein [Thermoguttaceae bacterium]|nr:aldehyde ferredoxin oxidoreductase family protein [Thermoguttaceae bacterium]
MAVPGTMGRILVVDLTKCQARLEQPDDDLYLTYLGGYGLGSYLLYKTQPAGVDPLGPENTLGFFAGLLTGTGGITSNRYVVVAKSPKTGGWGDANSGGTFGPAMKAAGLDGIMITGRSPRPVYLFYRDGTAQILPADDWWGLDTTEIDDRVAQWYGPNARAACIGPAGERMSLLSCVINEKYRAAGRSGLGAVMGSKRLKAVVVVGPEKLDVPIADAEGYQRAMKDHRDFLKTQPRYAIMRQYGTCGSMAGLVAKGDTPIRNWSGVGERDFPTVKKISDDAVIAMERKKYACWRCPLACGGLTEVTEGPFAAAGHKPEYETLGAFGSMCLNDDLASIHLCNDLCNRAGLDTISTGGTVAFAIECFENGLITPEETGGVELRWGNAEAIVEITRAIARREGFGAVLADGTKRAAERIGQGAERFAIHVGGEELPMHDPRLVPGAATSYQMDATPGRHTQISTWILELGTGPPDLVEQPQPQHHYPGKGKAHARINNYFHAAQSAGMCMFALLSLKPSALTDSLTCVTGHAFRLDDVLTRGARIAALRTAFNHREGVRNVDFRLPDRVIGRPPLDAGPTAGRTVDVDAQVADYLEAMGWDAQTGAPAKETLLDLGLDFVAEDLYPAVT